jgi:glycosyltransferase involved in cell wall biosynthesis
MDDARVRIVFVHFASDVGYGSDRSLFDIATNLNPDDFAVTMVLRSADPMATAYQTLGIPVHLLGVALPRRSRNPWLLLRFLVQFWPTVMRIVALIRKARATVVHVNTSFNLHGGIAARIAGVPLVWHVREIGEGGRADRAIKRYVCAFATRVIAISNAVARTLDPCGTRIDVIPNAVDLHAYSQLQTKHQARNALNLPENAKIVLTVGRLEPWKGQHILIAAARIVLESQRDTRFLIVGGPAANKLKYREELFALCHQLRISDSVVFLGARTDVPQLLAAADVLVLPSSSPEPFGRTVIEAMAAARPVIATAAGGPLETIVHRETGFLVEPANAGALASSISYILCNPGAADRVAQRARQVATTKYALPRLISDMTEILRAASAPPRAR